MQVFLTGATGYIGTAVADRLRAAVHKLTGLARSDVAANRLTAAGIRPVRGDFSDPLSWRPRHPDVLEDIERGSYVSA